MLARLVTSPRDAPQLTAGLPPATFTTDVRYDVYQAIVALAGRGGYYAPEQLAAELGMRMAAVPPHGLAGYGGAAGLFARAYLARLASTEVSQRGGRRHRVDPRPGRRAAPRAAGPGRGARTGTGASRGERPPPGANPGGRAAAAAAPAAAGSWSRRGAATVGGRSGPGEPSARRDRKQ